MPRTLRVSEDQTRKQMKVPLFFGGIDTSIAKHSVHRPQLEQAGWYLRDHSKVKIEKWICHAT